MEQSSDQGRSGRLELAASSGLALTAILLNNVTIANTNYFVPVVIALGCATFAVLLSARGWSRSSIPGRIVIALVIVGSLQTFFDAGGRRLPAILHW